MLAVEIQNFCKRYGTVLTVKGVNLSVARGEIFGLIGPDGAGKTTLMQVVCTLIRPDEGILRVLGMDATLDISSIRARIGYMPQRFSLYQDLTVEQNLRFFADLFQVPASERERRLDRLYRFSRLAPFKKRKAGALSGGMKQKLALSCALVHTPELLVLDEPTYGVDPVSRQEFWEILRSIQAEGTTIFVSTAYMDEADQCDRVGLMYEGEIKAVGTPEEIKSSYRYPLYRVYGRDVMDLRRFLQALPQVRSTQVFGDAVHVSFKREPETSEWLEWQSAFQGNVASWEKRRPSMEDVFMELCGSDK